MRPMFAERGRALTRQQLQDRLEFIEHCDGNKKEAKARIKRQKEKENGNNNNDDDDSSSDDEPDSQESLIGEILCAERRIDRLGKQQEATDKRLGY
jgi:hypothetical protein